MVSCPSFASFKFSCQTNHLISIENLVFSPFVNSTPSNLYSSSQSLNDQYQNSNNKSHVKNNECISDWSKECTDRTTSASFEYLSKECSGKETCTLIGTRIVTRIVVWITLYVHYIDFLPFKPINWDQKRNVNIIKS